MKIPLFKIKVEEKGVIRDIKEIIVRIDGLPTCLNGEIVDMGDGVRGLLMEYDEESARALVLGNTSKLRMGKEVHAMSEPFTIGMGDACIGRMINAMGEPLDEHGAMETVDRMPVFRDSPSLMDRSPITEMLHSGTKIVDMLTPIGKGQRQLILGDRMTGKSSVAIDAILNQKGRDVVCVYCCIGKSVSGLEKVMSMFHETQALDYTTVVVATDNAPVAEQYISPFTASSVGDYFARRGRDVLVVFDDITKHAWAYRQISLLLDRPPGREAYPGDIFYVHTQLMEQAGCFNENHGEGTMTFMALAETQQGDLTGYIPSNLVSMCDGQIVLSSAVYAEGARPAVDAQLSLSIVGGRAQPPILKALSSTLRADYANFVEIARLSRLSAGLSDSAAAAMKKGESIRAVFQQGHHELSTLSEMVLQLYAVHHGYLDEVSPSGKVAFCDQILGFTQEHAPALIRSIEEHQELTPDIEDGLARIVKEYFAHLEHEAASLGTES
ncbi:MAG: F0F1 ATP synthase subunit alpha [Verrucomicrobia bacterium]|nr:F0F1 ATP synthase subunit alpha [Verrucomicrobiota bacterium]